MTNGKGDDTRPLCISLDEYGKRYDKINWGNKRSKKGNEKIDRSEAEPLESLQKLRHI